MNECAVCAVCGAESADGLMLEGERVVVRLCERCITAWSSAFHAGRIANFPTLEALKRLVLGEACKSLLAHPGPTFLTPEGPRVCVEVFDEPCARKERPMVCNAVVVLNPTDDERAAGQGQTILWQSEKPFVAAGDSQARDLVLVTLANEAVKGHDLDYVEVHLLAFRRV